MVYFSSRMLLLLLSVASLVMILIALGMEHWLMLEPCPLCIFQRVGVIGGGSIALIAAIHNPRPFGLKVYGTLISLALLGSIVFAVRQLWLQSLPADQVPACGPSLDYLMDVLPLTQVLSTVFSGDGSCAEVSWSFLGLSIPAWVIIACLPMIVITIWATYRPRLKR
jgi:disulfide bond formation protein DsbB